MKTLRKALRVCAGALLALLLGTAALWAWSGSETSLATTLEQGVRFLPAGQSLEFKDVKGSLRGGGSIGSLHWRQGELSVQASHVTAAWVVTGWRQPELRLSQLAIEHLRIDDRRSSTPALPPANLMLPLRLAAQFSVATLEWAGPPALPISNLAGHYQFDGQTHRLDAASAQLASGQYRLSAQAQAQAPMRVSLQVQGAVQYTLPKTSQTLHATAQAQVQGQLGGRDAELELRAHLTPDSGATAALSMQASLVALLRPWQAQPIVSATAQWQALNLAALWPQAPLTALDGKAHITPAGSAWQADIGFSNAHAKPWNQQGLPIERLQAQLEFTQGQWRVQSLQASAGGGQIQAQGHATAATAKAAMDWQASATAQGVNPAALDSRLAATRLDGRLSAHQTPAGIRFDAQLQAAASAGAGVTLAGLRLKTLQARGLWQSPLLKIDALLLQSEDAHLQGQLQLQTGNTALQGHLTLQLPGASASADGQLASSTGQGEITLQISDAAQAANWLQRWPGSPFNLNGASAQGAATVSGRWHGGWQNQGRNLQIEARLQANQLSLRGAGQESAQTWRVSTLEANLSGTPSAWKLQAQGQAEQASRHFTLAAQAHGGQQGNGVWQAELESAQLSAQDSLQPGLWELQLAQRLSLRWQHSASARTLEIDAGSARLSAPLPGQALLNWQAARWSQQGSHGEWQTQGSLQGLPLAWLDRLGQTPLAQMGIGGDLLLSGQWQASGGAGLQLRATLERSTGDLLLQSDDAKVGTLHAGLSDARLVLTAQNEQVAASLHWRSERAGQAQAEFSSRLTRQGERWNWPVDAPLRGTLNAQLPPLADWSRLAPPGWRLRGTLQAQAELSGTRSAPQWHGTLTAQDLAVSSVVEGIDFSKGRLRAKLDGQRLEILEFALAGAGNAGLLSGSGSIDWLDQRAGAATPGSRLRMALEFQAEALRLSTLADRRLVLSGQLSARLEAARLTLRGKLKADEALFVLPDDTSPRLGDDVVLRAPQASSTGQGQKPAPSQPLGVTPDIAVSLDLGPRFRVRGHGLATRLSGQLELRSSSGRAPSLIGELRAVGGSYKAYGQQLTIEEGVLRFDGPYDNPALDILALRPQLQQKVGVRISGNVLSPVVRLYAEPDLPDAEKLAWLVLGRAPTNGSSEAVMLQQAALALLGSNRTGAAGGLAQAFGFDQLSLGNSASTTSAGTSETTVTLGKNIARNFYVAYERSLTSAMGSFYIFYELSRRFTLRAQTGEQSTLDLIFTLRYD